MIELAPRDRRRLMRDFVCSRRLATRLGALMGRKVTISATVLDEARPGSLLEKLLLDRRLLESPATDQALHECLREPEFADIARDFPLRLLKREEWQVIAAAEEELAEQGFGPDPDATSTLDAPSSQLPAFGATPDTALATLPSIYAATDTAPGAPLPPAAGRQPGGEAAPPFTPAEIARLRVTVFAGTDGTERVAALRRLAYAGLPAPERLSLFLQALAAEDGALRAAAAQALPMLGIPVKIADAIHLLNADHDDECEAGARRLLDLAPHATAPARDALLMALLGVLRSPDTSPHVFAVASTVLSKAAASLGPERLCRPDILRMLVDRTLGAGEEILLAVRDCLAAMEALRPGFASGFLLTEAARMQPGTDQADLLRLLVDLEPAGADLEPAMALTARCLDSLSPDSEACRRLCGFLVSRREHGLRLLAGLLDSGGVAHQRHMVRVLDNALRSMDVDRDTRIAIATAGLQALRTGPGQLRAEVLETVICARADLPAQLRSEITEAFLRDLHAYARPPLSDIMETALVRLGGAAVPPLLTVLAERRVNPDIAVVVRSLGLIGMRLRADDAGDNLPERILRDLQKISFGKCAVMPEIHLAIGRVCTNPAVNAPVVDLVLRTLLSRLRGGADDAAVIHALGLACNGRGANPEFIQTTAGLALEHLDRKPPDPTLQVNLVHGEEVLRIGGALEVYSALIPACIEALHQLVLGVNTPPATRKRIVSRLLNSWRRAIGFDLEWGPANIAQLTQVLGHIGRSDRIPDDVRVDIANTLASRAGDLPVLQALADILARGDDNVQLNRLAGSLGLRLLQLLESAESLPLEDQEEYLRILGRVALRGRFQLRGNQEERLVTRMLEALIGGLVRGVPGCYRHLAQLRQTGNLADKQRGRIDKVLERFTRVAARGG